MLKRWDEFIIWTILFLLAPAFASAYSCKDIHVVNNDTDHTLDITFITDGVFDEAEILKQLNNLVSTMQDISPFDEFIKNKINIRYAQTSYTNSLDCCYLTDICNHISVSNVASMCPTDEMVVFSSSGNGENNETCNGADGIAAFGQHSVIYAKPGGEHINDTSRLIIHELGHSMSFLDDEYPDSERDSLGRKFDFVYAPNCEKHPVCYNNDPNNCTCPKWQNVPGTGCYKGCTYEDWYREMPEDIMYNTKENPGPVDTMQFRSAINRYVEYVQEPASIEINKPTIDFITKKFMEKNNKTKAKVPIDDYNVQLSDSAWTILLSDLFISYITQYRVSYACFGDYYIKNTDKPKISIEFGEVKTVYNKSEKKISLDVYGKLVASGKSQIYSKEGIITIPATAGIVTWLCQDGIIDINWKTELKPVIMRISLYFNRGVLGLLFIRPNIEYIKFPGEEEIERNTNFEYILAPSLLSSIHVNLPINSITDLLGILFGKEINPSYRFAKEIKGQGKEFDIYLRDELATVMDDFGLSLKASLDELGIEQLGGTGKPHGMILDLYLKEWGNGEKTYTSGVEISDNEETWAARLSGPLNMNTPLIKNKAECVKDLPVNFNPIDYTGFSREITPSIENPFASIKLSQTFSNWFLATLWNSGYFCSSKEISPVELPDFLPPSDSITLTKAAYSLTPLSPPYIDYSIREDLDGDGNSDVEHDIASRGKAKVNLQVDYTLNIMQMSESINLEINYTVPMKIENPEVTIPKTDGFSFAQSILKVDVDEVRLIINYIDCKDGIICRYMKMPENQESIKEELKSNIVAQLNRASYEIAFNPVRDLDLNFGEVGAEYFDPPISLDYGQYVANIKSRAIEDKWMIYDIDFIEKCKYDNECLDSKGAIIDSVSEVYYKSGKKCETKKPDTDASKSCLQELKKDRGELSHYYKISYKPYNSENDPYVTYNYNLISWNPYKTAENNFIYLTESEKTYEYLKKSKKTGSGSGIVENLNKESDVHLLSYMSDGTSIVAVRSRTKDGVEQSLNPEGKCISAVIFDKDCNTLECFPQIVSVKIIPNFRGDSNDNYVVCEETYTREELDMNSVPNE